MAADGRGSNKQTEHELYSLQLIGSILQKQEMECIVWVLDLNHRCHQMPLHADSRPGTAVSTRLGTMLWKVVPMGAKNENAAFHHIMEDCVRLVRDCADLFVDDIIIGSCTEDRTDEKLIKMNARDKHSMVCKPKKASLFL